MRRRSRPRPIGRRRPLRLLSRRRRSPPLSRPCRTPRFRAELSEEDRLLLAREELFARLTAELSPERISILSRGELAKVVDAAVQAYFARNGIEPDPIARRDMITALIKSLLEPGKPTPGADESGGRRLSNRSAVEAAKAQIQPLVLEHMDVAAAAEMPRAVFEAQLSGWVKDLLTETKIQLNFLEQRELVESLVADMLGLGPLEPLLEDETVTDIMVNGARQVYVERRGKLELTGVRFRDDDHVMNVATKIVTRIGRRVDEFDAARRRPPRRRQPGQHHHPAARDRRTLDLDPQILEKDDHPRHDGAAGEHLGGDGDPAQDRGALPAQHPDLRRHRLGQDDVAQRACRG